MPAEFTSRLRFPGFSTQLNVESGEVPNSAGLPAQFSAGHLEAPDPERLE